LHHKHIIQINKNIIKLNKIHHLTKQNIIRINKNIIRLNKNIIRLNKNIIRLNKTCVRVCVCVRACVRVSEYTCAAEGRRDCSSGIIVVTWTWFWLHQQLSQSGNLTQRCANCVVTIAIQLSSNQSMIQSVSQSIDAVKRQRQLVGYTGQPFCIMWSNGASLLITQCKLSAAN